MSTTPLHTHHGTRWGPWTRLGAWAPSRMGLALAGTVALTIAFAAGLESADSFTDNWILTVVGAAILVSAAASSVTGLIATISHHDGTAARSGDRLGHAA